MRKGKFELILLWLLISMIAKTGCVHMEGRMNLCRFYYIPLDVQTYVPVDQNSIEARCRKSGVITLEQLDKLKLPLVKGGVPVFDQKNVRLKVICQNDVFLVDSGGVALWKDFCYKVDKASIDALFSR